MAEGYLPQVGGKLKSTWDDIAGAWETGLKGGKTGGGVAITTGQVKAPTPPKKKTKVKGPESTTVEKIAGPTAATIDVSQQEEFRAQQIALMKMLSDQSQGIGPSVSAEQLRVGQEGNIAGLMAAMGSSRGGFNPALARGALQSSAEIQGKLSQEMAMQRLQEQMEAQGLLGDVASTGRASDIDLAKSQADLIQEAGITGYKGAVDTSIAAGQIASNESIAKYQGDVELATLHDKLGSAV